MYSCSPDWRWQALLKAADTGELTEVEDELVGHVYDVMCGKAHDEDVLRALDLYRIPYKRDNLMAFLLSRATHEQIAQGLGLPIPVIKIFESLFIDPEQFRDKMDIRMYAELYRDNKCSEPARALIDIGMIEGPYALLNYWITGNETVEITNEELSRRILTMTYTKLMVARQDSLTSERAKEALKWVKAAAQVMRTRNTFKQIPASIDELMFEIEQDSTVNESIGDGDFDVSHILH